MSEFDEIVVTGTRLSNKRALETKRNASVIMDVLAADDLNKLPDQNLAEAVGRIPGATTFQDEGAGLYIGLRGLNQEFVNLTLNGLGISSAARTWDANLRGANLEAVPSSFISRVEVFKTSVPRDDADAIAGNVNLVTRSPIARGEPWLVISGKLGQYTEDVPTKGSSLSYKTKLSAGTVFGGDDQFGVAVDMHLKQTNRDNLKPQAFWRGGGGSDDPEALPREIGGYFYERDQFSFGLAGKLEFQPNPDFNIFAQLVYFDSEINLTKNKHPLLDPESNVANQTFTASKATLRNEYVEYGVDDSLTAQGGFDWTVNENNTLSARGSTSSSTSYQDDPRADWYFSGPLSGSYEYTGSYYPYTLDSTSYQEFLDPSNYSFNGFRHFKDTLKKTVNGLRFDWDNKGIGDSNWSFDVGFKWKETKANYAANYFRWRKPVDDHNFGQFIPPAYDFSFPYTNNDQVLVSDVRSLLPFIRNIGESGFGKVQGYTNGRDYSINESVYAGYASTSFSNEILDLTFGVRYEATKTNAQNRFGRTDDGRFVETKSNYDDFIPSVTGTYRFSDEVLLRFGASRTLGRPDVRDLAKAESEPDEITGVFSRGNPDLKARKSTNLDLSLEYYFDDGLSGVALALYHKDISNEIYDAQVSYTFTDENGNQIPSYFSQPQNSGGAKVQGVEFAFTKNSFDFLPEAFHNFGVNANVTLNDGSIDLIGDQGSVVRKTAPEGLSKFLANATLFYQGDRLSGRVAFRHIGAQNQGLSATGSADVKLNAYQQMDFQVSYELTDSLEVSGNIWNVLNNSQTFTNQNLVRGLPNWYEKVQYGRAFWLGFSLKY